MQTADGTVLRSFNPPPQRHINIDPTYRDTIRAGLRAGASQPGGTSADVFRNFPEQVYGKTGTAQYNGSAGLRLVRVLRAAERDDQADRRSS